MTAATHFQLAADAPLAGAALPCAVFIASPPPVASPPRARAGTAPPPPSTRG
ncbi:MULTISPECIES: hypothetical protein [Cupriavidus]|uniref:hypothetical protein n=1 Tax=Cupriavidus TaxID=106589 RepID=UPI0003A7067C|nr:MULTISPECIES: hypothetical protein [Cupriavidus]